MNDLERDLHAMFSRREADVRHEGLAPEAIRAAVRRTRRRQIGVVTAAVIVTVAIVAGAAVGLAALTRTSERRVPADRTEPAVATCPEGSTPDERGPIPQARPISNFYMPMAFDRGSGRIVLLRQGLDGQPSTWTFDVCTNTWQRMSPAREPVGGQAWGPMAYDADSDLTITVLEGGSVWAYDAESNTWTEMGPVPFDDGGYAANRMTYDPVSGLLWVRHSDAPKVQSRLWTYDVDTDTWAAVREEGEPSLTLGPEDHQLLTYDASIDRFVAFATGHRTWTFDRRTGAWTRMEGRTPSLNTGYFTSGGEAAYDDAAERTVMFSDGFVGAYDPIADRWTRLYGGLRRCCQEGPLNRLGHWMVYDPVNARLVVYGGRARGVDPDRLWVPMDDVWAFDVGSGEWIQLLARSESSA